MITAIVCEPLRQLPRRPERQASERARAIYMPTHWYRAFHLRNARSLNAEMKRHTMERKRWFTS
jgi:hypothetical protein